MATIPLTAALVKPVEQPDVLQNYSRLAQLRGLQQEMQQRAAIAPYQQQAAEQQAQIGALNLKQTQREMDSQNAIMQAWSENNGDLSKTVSAAAKTGKVLPADLAKLQQANLQVQQESLKLYQAKGERAIQEADLWDGAADQVNKAPAALKPQVYQQQLSSLAQQGLDTSQLPQQYPGDQQFSTLQLGLKSHKNALEAIAKQAEIDKNTAQAQEATANAQKTQQQGQWYQQHGLAPGISPDQAGMADFLFKNPKMGPSDYIAWKAKQAPLAQLAIMNATGNGQPAENVASKFGMSPTAFDQTAEKYWTSGQLPPVGRGGAAMAFNRAIMNRAAELHPNGSLAANSAEYKANEASLKKFQAFADTTSAFEQTAIKNMNLLQSTLKDIPDLGARFANVPARSITGSMIGTANMAKFKTALNVAQTEAAKVLNNPNSSGVLSDSARHDLQEIIDGNMPVNAIIASLDTLRQDMENRTGSNRDTIADIQQRLSGASGGNGSGSQQNQSNNGGGFFSQFGGVQHK